MIVPVTGQPAPGSPTVYSARLIAQKATTVARAVMARPRGGPPPAGRGASEQRAPTPPEAGPAACQRRYGFRQREQGSISALQCCWRSVPVSKNVSRYFEGSNLLMRMRENTSAPSPGSSASLYDCARPR